MYYLVLWRGAGLSAGPQTFISLFSLPVAVGEDGEIWKLYGIKRKRLIKLMLITWDLEKKFFAVIIHHHKQVITTFQMLWKQVRSERQFSTYSIIVT